ncbi:hypothetical protein CTAYLR_008773 [Chrysophaeum taylorii]|uniref:PH domain-containing protein n=1 Tax=Chrysophaeum taylorii TaxID=2483200 RepID=A0AAD7XLC2_9STRA|nr:hypothetical protein CTAYLR_008773 [Chrysophaeum taylorii]
MLARNIELIHGVTTQSEIGIMYQEVQHIQSCFSLMATVSALLAGFEFTVFGLETESVGEYSELHASSVAYMIVASLSLGVNLIVVCVSTLCATRGPGLALGGARGSVAVALDGMRAEYRVMSDMFMFGIHSFFAMVTALVWFEYDYVVAAPVSSIMCASALALALMSSRVKRRFALRVLKRGDLETGGNQLRRKRTCRACGAASSSNARYCARCGTSIVMEEEEEEEFTAHLDYDDTSVEPITKRGPLLKRGKHLRKHAWNSRFFEVKGGTITYWDREGGNLLRSLLLAGVGLKCEPITENLLRPPTPHCFALTIADSGYRVELCASTESEMQSWIVAISRNSNPAFAPEPTMAGRLDGRRSSQPGPMQTFDAILECSRLSLSQKNIIAHAITVADAAPWDGRGLFRTRDHGILVTDVDGTRWQLCAPSLADRRAWLESFRRFYKGRWSSSPRRSSARRPRE